MLLILPLSFCKRREKPCPILYCLSAWGYLFHAKNSFEGDTFLIFASQEAQLKHPIGCFAKIQLSESLLSLLLCWFSNNLSFNSVFLTILFISDFSKNFLLTSFVKSFIFSFISSSNFITFSFFSNKIIQLSFVSLILLSISSLSKDKVSKLFSIDFKISFNFFSSTYLLISIGFTITSFISLFFKFIISLVTTSILFI